MSATFSGTSATTGGPSNNTSGGGGGHDHSFSPSIAGTDQVGAGGRYVATYTDNSKTVSWVGDHTHSLQNHTHNVTAKGSVTLNGDEETRPINYTIRIWKRIN